MKTNSISFVACQAEKLVVFLRSLSLEQRLIVSRSFDLLGIDLTALLSDSRLTLPVYNLSVGDTVILSDSSSSPVYFVKKFRLVNGSYDAFIVNPQTRFGFWVSVSNLKIQLEDKNRNGKKV